MLLADIFFFRNKAYVLFVALHWWIVDGNGMFMSVNQLDRQYLPDVEECGEEFRKMWVLGSRMLKTIWMQIWQFENWSKQRKRPKVSGKEIDVVTAVKMWVQKTPFPLCWIQNLQIRSSGNINLRSQDRATDLEWMLWKGERMKLPLSRLFRLSV